jgi:hypothetical protein
VYANRLIGVVTRMLVWCCIVHFGLDWQLQVHVAAVALCFNNMLSGVACDDRLLNARMFRGVLR